MSGQERTLDRLVRDMRGAADANRSKADVIDNLADKLEDGKIDPREMVERCIEEQIFVEAIPTNVSQLPDRDGGDN